MRVHTIKVLVVEDSAVIRAFLKHLLESDPQIRVIGAVTDGQAALDFVATEKPDVVLMDIFMPRMDGFEATRRIMASEPVPIVICSATANVKDVLVVFQAMDAGAVACIEKPHTNLDGKMVDAAETLVRTIKLMAEVKVVRRWSKSPSTPAAATSVAPIVKQSATPIEIVGIGASTGGPPVLQTIFSGLPKDFPLPIVVVQHIAPGFLVGMTEWLSQTTGLRVQIATHGTYPLPGHVYLAPDDKQMGLDSSKRITLSHAAAENYLRPAVSFLFRSLGKTYGANALGVLLTGMGKDGAEELKAMKDRGATTIAQDFESAIVHGMPGEAIALGAATFVKSAKDIAGALIHIVNSRNGQR